MRAALQLVIFDFDGTLFDTHKSIEHCIAKTFEHFQPGKPVDDLRLRQLMSQGKGLYNTFRALSPVAEAYDEVKWEQKYRDLYATEGQSLIKAYPGVHEVLHHVRSKGIPSAIVTNKGVVAVHTACRNHDLAQFFPDSLIVGDKTPGAWRKPDVGSYVNVLLPALQTDYGLSAPDPSSILVVGDTEADIQFAKNLGAQSCWCRYGYGSASSSTSCADLNPDFTVDSLVEVIKLI